jgi:hypothetical protein
MRKFESVSNAGFRARWVGACRRRPVQDCYRWDVRPDRQHRMLAPNEKREDLRPSAGPAFYHRRTYSPVAAVPGVAHFDPSVRPLAHTRPARTSPSAQLTLSVPVTTRTAAGGPGSPLGRRGLGERLRQLVLAVPAGRAHRPVLPVLGRQPHLAALAVLRLQVLGRLRHVRRADPVGRRVLVGLVHPEGRQGRQDQEGRLVPRVASWLHLVGANVSTKAAKAAASAHRVSQNAL